MFKNLINVFFFLLVFVCASYSALIDLGRFGSQRELLGPNKKVTKNGEVYVSGIITEDEIEEAREELTKQMKSLSIKDINPNKVGFDSMELDLSSVAYPVVLLSDGIETGGFTISVEICRAFNNLLLAHKKCVVVPTDNEYVSASFLRQGLHSPSYSKVGLDADYIVTKASILALGQQGRSLLKDTKYLDLVLKLGSEPMFFMVKKGSDINTFARLREYLLDNMDTKQRIFIGNKKYAFDIVAFFAALQLPIENLQFVISEDKDAVISDFCAKGTKEDILIEYFHTDSTRKMEASGCVSEIELVYFTRQELTEVESTPFADTADIGGKIPKALQNNYYKLRDESIEYMKDEGDLSEEEAIKKYKGVYVPTTDIVLAASRNADGKEVFQMVMSYLYSFISIKKNENINLMVRDIKRGQDLLSPYTGTNMIYHPVVVNYALFNDLFLGSKSLRRMEKEFMNFSLRRLKGKSSGSFFPLMPTTTQLVFLANSDRIRLSSPPPPPPVVKKANPTPTNAPAAEAATPAGATPEGTQPADAKAGGKETPANAPADAKAGSKETPAKAPADAKAGSKETPAKAPADAKAGSKETPAKAPADAKAGSKETPAKAPADANAPAAASAEKK